MTKETLIEYRSMAYDLNLIRKRIKQLKEDARTVKGFRIGGDIPSGRGEKPSAMQRYLEKLDELEWQYLSKATEMSIKEGELAIVLVQLPPNLAALIRLRYIFGYSWAKVMREMHISESTSMRWHREALEIIEKIEIQKR